MTLVERGTHPKWTGGFVTDPKCECGHGKRLHGSWEGVSHCYHQIERRTPVAGLYEAHNCRCTGWGPR